MKQFAVIVLLLSCIRLARADSIASIPEPVALLGHMVQSRTSKEIGRVVDILINRDGRPQAAVLDVGGFLGVGTRHVAVAWGALRFSPAGQGGTTIAVDIASERIKAAPAYEAGKPVMALTIDAAD